MNTTPVSFPSNVFFDEAVIPDISDIPSTSGIANSVASEPSFIERKMFPTATSAMKTAAQIQPQLERLLNTTDVTMENANALLMQFQTILSNVTKMMEGVKVARHLISKVVEGLTILVDIVIIALKKYWVMLPTLIARLMNILSVPEKLGSLIASKLTSLIPTEISGEANNGTHLMQNEGIKDMLSVFTWFTGLVVLGRDPEEKALRAVNDKIRFLESSTRLQSKFVEALMTALRHLPTIVQEWLYWIMPSSWWAEIFAPNGDVVQWLTRVELLHTEETKLKASYDRRTQEEIVACYNEGQKLLKDLAERGPQASMVFRLMESHMKKIDTLFDLVDLSSMQRAERLVPFVCYCYGPPGTGKSFITSVLPLILAGAQPTEPNIIYSRSPCIPHWDGYTGQFSVVYDDFGATRGTNVAPGEYAEMMAIVSNVQYQLPMAALEDKGAVFSSKVVMVSSNVSHPRPNELNDFSALWRRRNILVRVGVREQFRMVQGVPGDERVDPNRIPADNSHWIFQIGDPMTPERLGPEMSYQQFVRVVKEKYLEHFRAQNATRVAHHQMVMDAIRNRGLEAMDLQAAPVVFPVEHLIEHPVHVEPQLMQNESLTRSFLQGVKAASVGMITAQLAEKISRKLIAGCINLDQPPNWLNTWRTVSPYIFTAVGFVGVAVAVNGMRENRKEKEEVKSHISNLYDTQMVMSKTQVQLGALLGDLMNRLGLSRQLSREEIKNIVRNSFGSKLNEDQIEEVMKLAENQGAYVGPKTTPKLHQTQIVRAQSGDPNASELVENVLANALVRVEIGEAKMNAIAIGGRRFLIPMHIRYSDGKLTTGGNITIEHQGVVFREQYNPVAFHSVGADLGIYEFGATMRAFKDLSHLFMKDEDLDRKTEYDALLVQKSVNSIMVHTIKIHACTQPHYYSQCEKPGDFWRPNIEDLISLMGSWEYTIKYGGKGMCGSVIVLNDRRMPRKICGIHVAGKPGGGYGYAEVITQEKLSGVPGIIETGNFPEVDPQGECRMVPEGNFTYIGKLKQAIFQPIRSKILPSGIYGQVYAPTTAPAVLYPKDPRNKSGNSPMKMSVEKYGKPACVLDEERVLRCIFHLAGLLKKKGEKRVFTSKLAILGLEEDFAEPLNLATSPGYPYVHRTDKIMAGKHDLIKDGEIVSEQLKFRLEWRERAAKRGARIPSIWIDSLKDERRSLDKVASGKTRTFTIAPVDFTILFRMYCLDFCQHMYNKRIKTFSCVGINPESNEWTALYMKLRKFNAIGFAGDYSGWDGNIHPRFIVAVAHIMNLWYDDDYQNQMVRSVLMDEIAHTYQVAIDCVYQTHVGNPSGNPMTSLMNTLVQAIMLRYIYLELAPAEYASLAVYEDNVGEAIYGDDNIIVPSEAVSKFFNAKSVCDKMKELNMSYTNTTKDGPPLMQPLEELTFLKRGFRKVGIHWWPLMEEKTIREIPNWVRESDFETPEAMMINNINESLRFWWFYGRYRFDHEREKLLARLKASVASKIHDFEYFKKWYYSGIIVPEERDEEQANLSAPQIAQISYSMHMGRFFSKIDGLMQNESGDAKVANKENTKGIISLDQRSEEHVDNGQGKATIGLGLSNSICEAEWSIPDMTKRKVWVGTFQWKTTDTQGTVLQAFESPKDFLLNYFQTAAFERFTWWRGTVSFEIHLNATRFHAGRLVAFFVPFTNKDNALKQHGVFFGPDVAVPHTFVDAAVNNPIKITAAFTNPKSFITLNNLYDPRLDFTGVFMIRVLSPLVAATASPSTVDFNVWVTFEDDQKFRVPLHSGAASILRFPGSAPRGDLLRAIRGGNLMQNEGNTITNMTKVENYGKIMDMSIPSEMTGDSIGNGNSATVPVGMTMDKPAFTPNGMPMFRVPFQHISNTVGPERVHRLDLNPSCQNLSTGEHFGVDLDEMAIQHLVGRPTYLTTVNWPATAASGTSLASYFIGPMASLFGSGSVTPPVGVDGNLIGNFNSSLTALDYVSNFFTFWRGDIKIIIEIVCTQMHTGRLFLSLNYAADPTSETGLRDATSQFGVEIEVNMEKRTFEFIIPYKAPTLWLNVCRGELGNTGDPGSSFLKYFTGSWNLRVMNALVTTEAAPPDAQILIYVGGGDNFELHYPGLIGNSIAPCCIATAPPSQGDLEESESEDSEVEVVDLQVPPRMALQRQSMQGMNRTLGSILFDSVRTQKDMHLMQNESSDNKECCDESDVVAVPTREASEVKEGDRIEPPESCPMQKPISHFGRKAAVTHLGQILKRYGVASDYFSMNQFANFIPAGGQSDNMMGVVQLDHTSWNSTGTGAADTVTMDCLFYKFWQVQPSHIGGLEATSVANVYYVMGSHALDYFMPAFRTWRGGINVKVLWGEIQFPTIAGVTPSSNSIKESPAAALFIPWSDGFGGNRKEDKRQQASTLAALYASSVWNCRRTDTTFEISAWPTMPMAFDIATPGTPYNEIQIPFTTRYNVLCTQTMGAGDVLKPELTSTGLLLMMRKFSIVVPQTYYAALQQQTGGIVCVNHSILKAAADDFRYGMYLGPPICAWRAVYQKSLGAGPQNGSGIFPDGWKLSYINPSTKEEVKRPVRKKNLMQRESGEITLPAELSPQPQEKRTKYFMNSKDSKHCKSTSIRFCIDELVLNAQLPASAEHVRTVLTFIREADGAVSYGDMMIMLNDQYNLEFDVKVAWMADHHQHWQASWAYRFGNLVLISEHLTLVTVNGCDEEHIAFDLVRSIVHTMQQYIIENSSLVGYDLLCGAKGDTSGIGKNWIREGHREHLMENQAGKRDPTECNLQEVVNLEFARHQEHPDHNYRMMIEEVKAKISTVTLEYDYDPSGQPHDPSWSCHITFKSEIPHYEDIVVCAGGKRKDEAKEYAAEALFIRLRDDDSLTTEEVRRKSMSEAHVAREGRYAPLVRWWVESAYGFEKELVFIEDGSIRFDQNFLDKIDVYGLVINATFFQATVMHTGEKRWFLDISIAGQNVESVQQEYMYFHPNVERRMQRDVFNFFNTVFDDLDPMIFQVKPDDQQIIARFQPAQAQTRSARVVPICGAGAIGGERPKRGTP